MNQFQKVHFRTIADFFDFLPEKEAVVAETLRELIKATLPEATEKLSYNVPFYRKRKNICFIWPAAVPWGNIVSGVQIGFTQGHLLQDEDHYLEQGRRKYVRVKSFQSISDIDVPLIRDLLLEAEAIDRDG